eukprot:NODE_8500_length_380_cov_189.458462.p2 GENE.NODE_8500_length_380_cov_189.458462~~NODE_8500_length_380_cov_189.458462.p2  ORF type:complete len:105 (-),score=20.58 NODE_8500_length_380_cov_189.458462:48-362(-)
MGDVEVEMMQLLGDLKDPAEEFFVFRQVPEDDEWLRPRGVDEYIVLASQLPVVKEMERTLRENGRPVGAPVSSSGHPATRKPDENGFGPAWPALPEHGFAYSLP